MADDAKKVEEKKEETKDKNLDPKLQNLLDEVAKLTVLELSELVKAMEEKFGVQAVAAAPAAGAAAPAEAGAPAEEKDSFDVVLTDAGAGKINVIKALREIKPELGL